MQSVVNENWRARQGIAAADLAQADIARKTHPRHRKRQDALSEKYTATQ
jgi:hypothetical protein